MLVEQKHQSDLNLSFAPAAIAIAVRRYRAAVRGFGSVQRIPFSYPDADTGQEFITEIVVSIRRKKKGM